MKSKCLPCLLHGLDSCPVIKTESRSLEFHLTRVLMKIFQTKSVDVVRDCQMFFGVSQLSFLIDSRKIEFLKKFSSSVNILCERFSYTAKLEISKLSLVN